MRAGGAIVKNCLPSLTTMIALAICLLGAVTYASACVDQFVLVDHWCNGCGGFVRVLACQGVRGASCTNIGTWIPCGGDTCMVAYAGPCGLEVPQGSNTLPTTKNQCGGMKEDQAQDVHHKDAKRQ